MMGVVCSGDVVEMGIDSWLELLADKVLNGDKDLNCWIIHLGRAQGSYMHIWCS
jgi:hypothetical protein